MSVAVKICGLSRREAVEAAVRRGAAYLGFVFYPPSPRHLGIAEAAALAASAPASVTRVGVFVDPEDALLEAVLAKVPLEMLQLHGREPPERASALRRRFGKRVMKAVAVAGAADLEGARRYFGAVDWLMFDAKPPKERSDALPGGNALAFDWRLLRGSNWPMPWMLSGGLTVENLVEAARMARPSVLDVSSGVESSPGVKDVEKIAAFLAKAKTI